MSDTDPRIEAATRALIEWVTAKPEWEDEAIAADRVQGAIAILAAADEVDPARVARTPLSDAVASGEGPGVPGLAASTRPVDDTGGI